MQPPGVRSFHRHKAPCVPKNMQGCSTIPATVGRPSAGAVGGPATPQSSVDGCKADVEMPGKVCHPPHTHNTQPACTEFPQNQAVGMELNRHRSRAMPASRACPRRPSECVESTPGAELHGAETGPGDMLDKAGCPKQPVEMPGKVCHYVKLCVTMQASLPQFTPLRNRNRPSTVSL